MRLSAACLTALATSTTTSAFLAAAPLRGRSGPRTPTPRPTRLHATAPAINIDSYGAPPPPPPPELAGSGNDIDVLTSSMAAFDMPAVLHALAEHTVTSRGREQAFNMQGAGALASAVPEALERYAAVTEMLSVLPGGSASDRTEPPPLRGPWAVDDVLAEAGGALQPTALRELSTALSELAAVRAWADREAAALPLLAALGRAIVLDPELVEVFADAFDAEGALCGLKFPKLGGLRAKVEKTRRSVEATARSLAASPQLKGKLADGQVEIVNGRYVLSVKPAAKRGVGIVHGQSRTGLTLYVEPTVRVLLCVRSWVLRRSPLSPPGHRRAHQRAPRG